MKFEIGDRVVIKGSSITKMHSSFYKYIGCEGVIVSKSTNHYILKCVSNPEINDISWHKNHLALISLDIDMNVKDLTNLLINQ